MIEKIGCALVLLTMCGCFGGEEAAYPLFSAKQPPPPASEIAKLAGPIDTIDGLRVVKYGSSFLIKAGCHDVTNRLTWGHSDNHSALIAHLPSLSFPVPMRGGYSYAMEIEGSTEGIRISMLERDPSGNETQRFEPGPLCSTGWAQPREANR